MQRIINVICVFCCVFVGLRLARELGYNPANVQIKFAGMALGAVLGLIIATAIGQLFGVKPLPTIGDWETSDSNQPNVPWSGS
jgi:hypothetical protein